MRVKRLWGNRPGGKRLGAKRLREEMVLGRNDPDSLGCPSYIRKLVVPFAVFLLRSVLIPQDTPSPGGVLLIFYIYIGLADFFGVKILKFSIFLGFQKNHYFFG